MTGSTRTPRLLADDAGWDDVIFRGDNRIRLPVSSFRFRPDGTLCIRSVPATFALGVEEAARIGQGDALRLKRAAARRGMVSFDDAMYWALRILVDHPDIAACVAGRFEELLVDEAQDTSELQLACVRALLATGKLDSLVLIGDLEQSISAYTGASRAGCEALASDHGLEPIELAENHRSSQRICNVAAHFCSRTEPDRAVGEDADAPWQPELMLYEADNPDSAVQRFRERIQTLGQNPARAAVLARSNKLVDELNGQTTVVEVLDRPLRIGRAVSALRSGGTLGRRQLEAVDRIVAFTATDARDLSELDQADRWLVRRATMKLLRGAPDLDQDLRDWIRGTARVLAVVVAELVESPRHKPGQVLTSRATQEGHIAAAVLLPVLPELRAQTVHEIKGESRDSVLVVVDRLRSKRHGAQSALWSRPLLGEAVAEQDAEELRIAFVALTRARRYCALALPDDCDDTVTAAFMRAGFEMV